MAKILIADDEAITGMHLEEVLTGLGYDVVGVASSGVEAMQMASVCRPDLAILDIMMPGELNGIETCRRMKADLEIPAVFLTAHSEIKIIEEAETADPYGYIIKPFHNTEIRIAVDCALRRCHAEKRLKENETRLNDILQSMSEIVWEIDANGVLNYISGRVKNILGYDADEMIGKSPFDVMPLDEAERMNAYLKSKAASKAPMVNLETWGLTRDGRQIRMLTNAVPVLSREGTLVGYRGVNRDITWQKTAAGALDVMQEFFNQVMDYLEVGAALINPAMEVVQINRRMAGRYPHIDPSVKPKCYHMFQDPPKTGVCANCPVVRTFRDGQIHEMLSEPTGESRVGLHRRITSPVFDIIGNIIAVVEISHDVKGVGE
ncbi:MAG: response regulator [Desulfatirhabdiaceae bacterium]